MTLATFHTDVANALGRGTSLSVQIPIWTRRAVGWLERNYTFQYMKRYLTLTVDPDADYPHYVAIGDYMFKKIKSVQYLAPGGDRKRPVKRIEPGDRDTQPAGNPSGYWLDGLSSFVLDTIPEEAIALHIHADLYTDWPSDTTLNHWMIRQGYDILFPRTMMNAARYLRNAEMFQTWKTDLTDNITTFNVAEEDLQNGGKLEQMVWSPEWDEFDENFPES